MRQRCPLFPFLFNMLLEILDRAIKQVKKTKHKQIGREEIAYICI